MNKHDGDTIANSCELNSVRNSYTVLHFRVNIVDGRARNYFAFKIISHVRKNIMIEVTNQNFNKVYPHLEHTLKNASFIAIDGEFTGIENDDVRNRLVYTVGNEFE